MALKLTVPMTTLVTDNEQTGVVPRTATTTGTSREYPELGSYSRGNFMLDVSAASGTPTLDVVIQGFNPASQKWHTVVTFAQQTGVTGGTPIAAQAVTLDFITYRAQWTVGGSTPSFTFTIVCIAHTEEPVPL